MKNIVVGSLRQESNSFSPFCTTCKDFVIATGEEMLGKIEVSGIFREAGYGIIPTLFAYAVPGGKVEEESFLWFKNYILEHIPEDGSVAGVWLYLHGAMEVDNLGSGEAVLVSEVRRKIGDSIPIAIALDFHANNTDALMDSANIVYGYKTAPHVDEKETQIKTAELLLRCINEGVLPKPVMIRLPLLLPGEMVTTGVEPTRSLMEEVMAVEEKEYILCASFFCGMAWVDSPNSGATVVVVGKNGTHAAYMEAKYLAGLFWGAREKFHFEEETAEPEEALYIALETKEGPVFITDSGDNVTAGAPGDSIYYLKLLMQKKPENVLVAGILDSCAVRTYMKAEVGDTVRFNLGGEIDPEGEHIKIDGVLKWKGKIFDITENMSTECITVKINGIDIIITENRFYFSSTEVIESAGLHIEDYKVIIVKQGYLYEKLRKISERSILAFTPGSACQVIEKYNYRHIRRPVYPINRDIGFDVK